MNATTEHAPAPAPAPVPAPDAGPGAADAACAAPPAIAALRTHAVARHRLGEGGAVSIQAEPQVLASEVPIALVFNGISHAVMMGTPSDLEDFALGFALTEGILDSAADCYGIEVRTVAAQAAGLPAGMDGIEVQLDVASRCFARLKDRRRSMSGRTGCGVCGVDSFAALDLSFDPLPAHDWIARVDADTVCAAIAALPPLQLLNAEAGAVHAAGWAGLDGQLTDVLEDVAATTRWTSWSAASPAQAAWARPALSCSPAAAAMSWCANAPRSASPPWPPSPHPRPWACRWPN